MAATRYVCWERHERLPASGVLVPTVRPVSWVSPGLACASTLEHFTRDNSKACSVCFSVALAAFLVLRAMLKVDPAVRGFRQPQEPPER